LPPASSPAARLTTSTSSTSTSLVRNLHYAGHSPTYIRPCQQQNPGFLRFS
jgi:hypothetical protein